MDLLPRNWYRKLPVCLKCKPSCSFGSGLHNPPESIWPRRLEFEPHMKRVFEDNQTTWKVHSRRITAKYATVRPISHRIAHIRIHHVFCHEIHLLLQPQTWRTGCSKMSIITPLKAKPIYTHCLSRRTSNHENVSSVVGKGNLSTHVYQVYVYEEGGKPNVRRLAIARQPRGRC